MEHSVRQRFGLLIAAPLLLGAYKSAAKPTIVTWSVVSVSKSSVRVRANVAKGWHMYALTQTQGGPKPLTFTLLVPSGFSLGIPIGPTPQRAMDAEFGIQTETYSGKPEFTIPLQFKGARPSRDTELTLLVRYQSCSDKLCLPPLKEALHLTVPARG